MEMDSVSVRGLVPSQQTLILKLASSGWYDSVYDEELGSQPCVFTSVTPVCTICIF